MNSDVFFTESDLKDYKIARDKVKSYLANILNIYCKDKSFTWMWADRIKSLRSINAKIEKKKSKKGDLFNPHIDLLDIAGLRIVFYDRNNKFPCIDFDSKYRRNIGDPMELLDEKIHRMSPKEFELEFEKSKFYEGNYNVYNLYNFVDSLARSWDRVAIIKDYIMYQKPSGYQSLHVIVDIPIETRDSDDNVVVRNYPVEIQFRNYTQHLYNECEHDRYKGTESDLDGFADIFDRSKRFLLGVSNDVIEEMLSGDKQYLLVRKF